jgi:hypothetical protein
MKRTACALLPIVIFLFSCSFASKKISDNILTSPAPLTIRPSQVSTPTSFHPTSTVTTDLTEIYVTALLATKYAGRAQFAALPTETLTPTISSSSRFCRPADLQTTSGMDGAYGHIILEVGLTNISQTACFLPARPTIQLLDRSGKLIEIAYDFVLPNASPTDPPPARFGLRVGQTARMLLAWGNWCKPAVRQGVIIRLMLLENAGQIDIPTDIRGGGHCDDPGSSSTIDIMSFDY